MGCGRSMPQRVEGVGGGASSSVEAVNLFFFNPSRLFVASAVYGRDRQVDKPLRHAKALEHTIAHSVLLRVACTNL